MKKLIILFIALTLLTQLNAQEGISAFTEGTSIENSNLSCSVWMSYSVTNNYVSINIFNNADSTASVVYSSNIFSLTFTGNLINRPISFFNDYPTVCITAQVTYVDGTVCNTSTFCMDILDCTPLFSYTHDPADSLNLSFSPLESLTNYLSYSWDFGDGNNSTNANPTHTFTTDSVYSVCLTILDVDSCMGTFCDDVITGDSCSMWINYNVINADSLWVYPFIDADPYTTSVIYTVDNTGDQFTYLQYFNPTYFLTDSILCITALITYSDSSTCSVTTCETIEIDFSNICGAAFSYNYDSLDSLTISFFPSDTLNDDYTYSWTFAGGDSSDLASPTYTYNITDDSDWVYACLTVERLDSSSNVICSETDCEWFSVVNSSRTISGTVNMAGDDYAIVYLIEYDPVDGSLTPIGFELADYLDYGQYAFTDVHPGEYLVKAALINGSEFYWDYLPTYYGDVELWSDASTVSALTSDQTGIDINLIAGVNSGGPGFISGLISDGAGKIELDGLVDIEVILYNDLDQPIAYTYSDEDGLYSFDNLPYGTYWVTADYPGFDFNMVQVIIDADQETLENIDVELGGEDVTLSDELISISTDLQIYIHVSNGSLIISNEIASSVEYNIFDIKGSQINSGEFTGPAYSIDISALSGALYLISFHTEKGQQSKLFLVR